MRIAGWHIEGFGIFRDFEARLPDGLTVFLGPNEAGKSTLLGFLRAMLFGFPSRRGRIPQYPPLRGGRQGGRLTLCGPRGEVTIERFAGRKNGVHPELQTLLGGADENVFCSVFAFSLSEMQAFEWLRADQIRERIFSAGIAGAGASARRAIETLEEEAAAILRPRGAARVRELEEQIKQAGARLQAAQAEAERYVILDGEYDKWSAKSAALSAEEVELRRRYEAAGKTIELLSAAETARAELAAIEKVDEFPSEPEARMAALTGRLDAARSMVQRLEEEQSAKAALRAPLAIDERLETMFNSIEEFHGRLALHRERLETLAWHDERKRLVILWKAAGACVAFAAGWLAGSGHMAAGVALLLGDLIAAGFLLRERAATAGRLERQIAAWEEPVQKLLGSSSRGERLIAEFFLARADCYSNREARAKAAKLDESLAESRSRLESGRPELAAAEAALQALLKEAGATDRDDFQKRLRTFRKRRELAALIQDLEGRIGEPGRSLTEWTTESSRVAARLKEVQKQRDEAVGEQRVADAERRRIAESVAGPAIHAELECLRVELAAAVREWRIATLAKELVARTLQEFTRTRQPAVLEEASSAFARVTAGAYERILQDEDRESLLVLDRSAQRKRPEELSRGTAEQLYLCLRLALASEFARRSAALPLIMDDVLVNFDPERAGAVARELARFSQQHQVLIFTCHPETARLFTQVAPGAAVIPLERYGAADVKDKTAGAP